MLLSFLSTLLIWNCGDSNNPTANAPFEGIVKTDSQGDILEEDPEDWQPRCTAQSKPPLCVKPAYPNPTAERTTLEWTINETLLVELSVSIMPDGTNRVLVNEVLSPGDYRLVWDVRDESGKILPDAIYRVLIKAMQNNIIQTEAFGDIQIQR